MKYLLSILCLLVLSCDEDSDIHGCLDSQACNYNPNASLDNNSCIYELDCTGECGNAEYDECGVCDGSGLNEDGCCGDEILLESELIYHYSDDGEHMFGAYTLYGCSDCEDGYYTVTLPELSESGPILLSCQDVDVLQDIIDANPSLDGQNPLNIGYDFDLDMESETFTRLINLDLSSSTITQLPESICDLSDECLINVSDNNLCDVVPNQFDCIDVWGSQSDCYTWYDIFIYDFGDDGIPGDNAWIDNIGDGLFNPWEGGNTLGIGFDVESIPSEPCFAGLGGGSCNENSIFIPAEHDCGLDGFCPDDVGWPGYADYGEGNGVWDNFDWNNNGTYDYGDIWDSSSWIDDNGDGIPDIDEFSTWEDTYPYGNNQYDIGEEILDCGQDGLCIGDSGWLGPDYGEGNGLIFKDTNELDGVYDTGDNCFGCIAEEFEDFNDNGMWDYGEAFTDDNLGAYGTISAEECQAIGGIFWDNHHDGIGHCGDGQYTYSDCPDDIPLEKNFRYENYPPECEN